VDQIKGFLFKILNLNFGSSPLSKDIYVGLLMENRP